MEIENAIADCVARGGLEYTHFAETPRSLEASEAAGYGISTRQTEESFGDQQARLRNGGAQSVVEMPFQPHQLRIA